MTPCNGCGRRARRTQAAARLAKVGSAEGSSNGGQDQAAPPVGSPEWCRQDEESERLERIYEEREWHLRTALEATAVSPYSHHGRSTL